MFNLSWMFGVWINSVGILTIWAQIIMMILHEQNMLEKPEKQRKKQLVNDMAQSRWFTRLKETFWDEINDYNFGDGGPLFESCGAPEL